MKIWRRVALSVGVIVGLFVLGLVGAYAGGQIIKHFDSKTQVTGKITIVAPLPTENDLVITLPDLILYTTGGAGNAVITVNNNSAYDLTCQAAAFNFPTEVGTMELADPVKDSILAKGAMQNIIIYYTSKPGLVAGTEYFYTGEITYSW